MAKERIPVEIGHIETKKIFGRYGMKMVVNEVYICMHVFKIIF